MSDSDWWSDGCPILIGGDMSASVVVQKDGGDVSAVDIGKYRALHNSHRDGLWDRYHDDGT